MIRGQNQQILQIAEQTDDSPETSMTASLAAPGSDALSFLFDKVFSDDQNNLDLFSSCLQPLIPQLLEGYNVSCFAYGMTGSGKTHTMFGRVNGPEVASDAFSTDVPDLAVLQQSGLCNLAIQNLFFQMLQRQDGFAYSVRVSYLELYNEKLRDLLYDLKDFKTNMSLKQFIAYTNENKQT